jgi:hypothetical protein
VKELKVQWTTIAVAVACTLVGFLAYLTDQPAVLAVIATLMPPIVAQLRQAVYFAPIPEPTPPTPPEPEIPVDTYVDPSERPTEPRIPTAGLLR